MQSFVIFYKSSLVYRAGTGTVADAWDGALAALSVGVVSTSASSVWFDLTKACWAFLQVQEFDAIVAGLE